MKVAPQPRPGLSHAELAAHLPGRERAGVQAEAVAVLFGGKAMLEDVRDNCSGAMPTP